MSQPNAKKDSVPSEVRVIVEVDGNPVGFLNLDVGRLWPLINHWGGDGAPAEWMDGTKFDSIMRAAVVKRLISRLEKHLYRALGDEMVKAELDVETFRLKAEAAIQRTSNNWFLKWIERRWISTPSSGNTCSTNETLSI